MNKLDLLKSVYRRKYSTGFTLTELIIASFISIVVVGAAGFGLLQMMSASGSNSDETERREEVNRAMDFISDEVRRARRVWQNYPGSAAVTGTRVLQLEIPDVDGNGIDEIVTYHIVDWANLSSSSQARWYGPQVLYRTGPAFKGDGDYSIDSGTGLVNTSTNPLIDRLVTFNTPPCGGLVSPTPSSGDVPGFAVCLENSETVNISGTNYTAYEAAQLHFNAVFDSSGSDTYTANSKVYARVDEDFTVAAATPSPSSYTPPTSSCSIANNGISCTNNTIMTIRSIGSSYSCDTSGTNWNMKTTVKLGSDDGSGNIASPTQSAILDENNSSTTVQLAAGESTQVESDPYIPTSGGDWSSIDTTAEGNCLNSSNPVDSTNTTQVSLLDVTNNSFTRRDGYDFTPDDDSDDDTTQQDSIFDILAAEEDILLTKELVEQIDRYQLLDDGTIQELQDDGSYADTTHKVVDVDGTDYIFTSDDKPILNIEKDQQVFLYLFEIGQTDTSAPGFDQQDNIVLIITDNAS
ncbi:PulJ/GspJ family protein [Myxosarcina sp. GI1(2024)]